MGTPKIHTDYYLRILFVVGRIMPPLKICTPESLEPVNTEHCKRGFTDVIKVVDLKTRRFS